MWNWKLSWRTGLFSCLCHWPCHFNYTVTADYILIFWMESVRDSWTDLFLIDFSQLQEKHIGICPWVYQIAKRSVKPLMCQPLWSSMTEVFCISTYNTNTLPSDLPSHAHKWSGKVKSGIALRSCWGHQTNGLGEMNGVAISTVYSVRRNYIGWVSAYPLVARPTL